jgi:formylglycine-generating enzyme required for sulfatase activity
MTRPLFHPRLVAAVATMALAAFLLPMLGRAADDAPAAPGDKEYVNSLKMKLVLIPKGTFLMGSPEDEEDRQDNEGPRHEVEITRAFYMGAYPVTKGQFAAFVKDAGYKTEAEADGQGGYGYDAANKRLVGRDRKYSWRETGFEQGDDHPVVNVTWNDAREFCRWLSKKEGKAYELPTEAEWEYACRAGTTTRYWCGDAEESLKGNANVADASLKDKYPDATWAASWDDSFPFTSPVGKFKANPWGLYDMHGNVWQWCADRYGPYQKESIKDPNREDYNKDPQKNKEFLILRGGSWGGGPRDCRSANRYDVVPSNRLCTNGFRVVLRPPAKTP